tara:strand:+ start:210 stop:500 length:291 start_codon:yes stop_codon:yes gene_type:complete
MKKIFNLIKKLFKRNKHKFHIYNNRDRADKIKRILGLRGNDDDEEYYRIADVISDLKHFCDYHKHHEDENLTVDFDEELRKGLEYYEYELKEEKQQ